MEKILMICVGFNQFDVELCDLCMVECFVVICVIVEVCEYGDLFENVEYYVVCEKQSFVEGCIKEFEGLILCVEVIDLVKLLGSIKFGVIVILLDEVIEEECIYQIVGEFEVDLECGLLNICLFLVCVLIGKDEGDSVEVVIFGGGKFYEIMLICFV